ncbi:hypothetical protein [Defluviimonas sp. WL0075]|uniref:M24 family metallopeptidase n=1 Tax=Albidovulum sediminicola TaxID=2984331 RepID=A0ABT2Z5I3_9RHOB|nr:hypothetical protein [Defluviimonas sp. WL0075]MCV2866357.1 hypothetical protein [Defluviimonas sp. WL0075]
MIAEAGRRIGASVTLKEVAFEPQATEVPAEVRTAMALADRTVFLARIGDQLRFSDMKSNGQAVVSYALDVGMLGSAYGTADFRAFDLLKSALNRMLGGARAIHVTCPAGTDFRGGGPRSVAPLQDVSIYRFPMPVFTPIPAAGFTGTVALPGFLVGTGSMYYDPYAREYDGALFATFTEGRIVGFSGDKAAVDAAEAHYRFVADKFGVDRDFVHSWHAGIHPGCEFSGKASDNYERWSGAAFGNPRLLHFHTCGAYAPGEISWNIVDPTIIVDGIEVWKDGVLHPELVPGGPEILDRYPCAKAIFAAPKRNIGF